MSDGQRVDRSVSTHKRRRRFAVAVAAATALGLALAGCTGNGGSRPGDRAAAEPKDGGTITVGVDATSAETTIDPHVATGLWDIYAMNVLYEP